jgi:sec-independent protein translocase protein TatC
MPLFDHLGELRRRVFISVISLFIAACVLYMVTPQLIQFLIDPIRDYMTANGTDTLVVLDPLGGFTIRFKVSFFCSFIVTSPIWLWQIFAFFLPALKENERKWVIPTFSVGVFLFALGMGFCYGIILRPAFQWMMQQSTDIASILPTAQEYLTLIMQFEVGFGIAFELPLIVFYLLVFNIVPYKKLRSAWRTVYVVLLVISAFVTPDASPVTMILMFAAIAPLYELSLLAARIVLNRRIKAQRAKDLAEQV